jgi:hypothetical protein
VRHRRSDGKRGKGTEEIQAREEHLALSKLDESLVHNRYLGCGLPMPLCSLP